MRYTETDELYDFLEQPKGSDWIDWATLIVLSVGAGLIIGLSIFFFL